ncbi:MULTISPECIES: phage baseplate assembly protein domain-containing protein [Klebsiella/Raoultella group]|uniref:phage baseplate assembly protein domain-containing protein n=1 Tax=Klebsiella/Raoultella group TaxID=2890311 RepID=UPI001F188767|nr:MULTISPECIES: phage baseplate assembly protein [Raoultella]MCE9802745.1 phage baseplate assembly protein [Raoultella ornithinolytica]MCE9814333.1 phage baseplate assembly protein [Raoultella ornithinolytica]MCE9869171.1 phage baseplate assembly protein [Raoultella ornithinolytica]
MNQFRHIANRIASMLGVGRVTAMQDTGGTQSVQYQTPLEVASAHRLAEFGFSSGLPVGTDVVLAFLGGDRSNPVVIATNHQGYRHSDLSPGETVMYNQWGLYIQLTEDGISIDAKGQDVTVNNAKNLTATATEQVKLITPKLLVTGDVIDNCETNDKTLKQLRDAYNDHDHEVKGVEQGNDAVTSEKPGEQV